MPISDYASAFFFDRRNRVTREARLNAVAQSRLLFQKYARSMTGINIVVSILDFLGPPCCIWQNSSR